MLCKCTKTVEMVAKEGSFLKLAVFFLETISWLLKGERELGQLSKA